MCRIADLDIGRTADALRDLFGLPVAPATITAWVKRTALGIIDHVLPVIRDRIRNAPVACFDETGMRVEGRLAWLHSASTPTDVFLSVHPNVAPPPWTTPGSCPASPAQPCTTPGHRTTPTPPRPTRCATPTCCELVYVTDTATGHLADLATQAITALRQLNRLVSSANASQNTADPDALREQQHLLRSAVLLGAEATAQRGSKLQRKHHALFIRLRDRDDYLRFVTDPAVPFDNNRAEQTIRMPKLRIKVSGSMRTTTGAQHFAAIRSYTATAIPAGHQHARRPPPGRHRQPLDPHHRLKHITAPAHPIRHLSSHDRFT